MRGRKVKPQSVPKVHINSIEHKAPVNFYVHDNILENLIFQLYNNIDVWKCIIKYLKQNA